MQAHYTGFSKPARALRLKKRDVALQPRVFDLLVYLIRNRARVVGKDGKEIMLRDVRQAWDLLPDGSYAQRRPAPADAPGTHQILMDLTRQRSTTIT